MPTQRWPRRLAGGAGRPLEAQHACAAVEHRCGRARRRRHDAVYRGRAFPSPAPGLLSNNVTWDWQSRLTYVNGDSQLNHLNNYYGLGSRGGLGNNRNVAATSYDHAIYTAGNHIDEGVFTDASADNRELWLEFNGGAQDAPLGADHFVDAQYPLLGAPLPVLSATDAFVDVVADSGCNRYLDGDGVVTVARDAIDDEYVAIIGGGEGSHDPYENSPETFTGEARYIDFHAAVSATPLASRPAGYDTDGDGMPDAWESAHGSDPSVDDGAGDLDADGYTNVEEFLNQVD